jgi:hypothetical protein
MIRSQESLRSLAADLARQATEIAGSGALPPDGYLAALTDFFLLQFPDFRWLSQANESIELADSLIEALEDTSGPCPDFKSVVREVANHLLALKISGESEFARGRRAGVQALSTRLPSWQNYLIPAKSPAFRGWAPKVPTWPAKQRRFSTDRERSDELVELLEVVFGPHSAWDQLATDFTARLPTIDDLVVIRDDLRDLLRTLYALERDIRQKRRDRPSDDKARLLLCRDLEVLAQELTPQGTAGGPYGTGFAAVHQLAANLLRQAADRIRPLEFASPTAADIDF